MEIALPLFIFLGRSLSTILGSFLINSNFWEYGVDVGYDIEELFGCSSWLKSHILKGFGGVYVSLCQFESRVEPHTKEGLCRRRIRCLAH